MHVSQYPIGLYSKMTKIENVSSNWSSENKPSIFVTHAISVSTVILHLNRVTTSRNDLKAKIIETLYGLYRNVM